MKRLRVMVVDDSATVRKLLGDAVQAEADLELCASAQNGQVALDRLEAARPDVVTLDLEMPVMDGLSTLRELKRRRPGLPVLVVSSHTERGALVTLDALAAGASDFVAKRSASGVDEARRIMSADVIPRVRSLAARAAGVALRPRAPTAPAPVARASGRAAATPELLVIGVSTGGPNALEALLGALPRAFPVPIVIVQHMPTLFTRLLAERLDARGPLRVREAVDGARLEPGHAWIAQGGRHLLVAYSEGSTVLQLDDGPPESSCRPAVDPLFRSAARACGAGVLGLVLTGMGSDGLEGSRTIVKQGGAVLAQDEATSVVWGMPGAVVGAGLAEAVLPLPELAAALVARVQGRGPAHAERRTPGRGGP